MSRVPRPSAFHPRIAGEILGRIAGGEALTRVCGAGRKKGYPGYLAVYNWIARYPNFRVAYLTARLAQAERMADEVVEIADGLGPEGAAPRDLARDRMRMEARRWRAAVLAPKVYAGQLEAVGQAGPGEEDEADEDAVAARIAAILEAARVRKLKRETLLRQGFGGQAGEASGDE